MSGHARSRKIRIRKRINKNRPQNEGDDEINIQRCQTAIINIIHMFKMIQEYMNMIKRETVNVGKNKLVEMKSTSNLN